MSEATANNNDIDKEENYEIAKLSYEVMESYELPSWFLKYVWLWPMVASYIFILYFSAPENLLFSVVTYGGYIVFLGLTATVIRKHWPM